MSAGTMEMRATSLLEPFRVPLLAVAALAFLGFAVDTWAALTHAYLWFDVTTEKAVQATNWGPVLPLFDFFGWLGGLRQLAAALLALAAVFFLNRKAAPLMTAGALTGVLYNILNVLIHRPRPDGHLVHVATRLPGYGYPSGHAAFFLSFSVLLVLCLGGRYLPRFLLPVAWVLAALVVVTACISRVYVGAHWPSDVLGGLLLGTGWTCLAISIRRLSDPVLKESHGR